MKRVEIKINEDAYSDIKRAAEAENTTVSSLIRKACACYLDMQSAKKADETLAPYLERIIKDLEKRLVYLHKKIETDITTVHLILLEFIKNSFNCSDDEASSLFERLKTIAITVNREGDE